VRSVSEPSARCRRRGARSERLQGIVGGSGMGLGGSRRQRPRSQQSDILSPAMRRYLIYALLAVVWCCLWVMVGLILYLA
jgi:hypothetical protein